MHDVRFFFKFCTESACKTPDNQDGECVLVRECPKLLDSIYKYSTLSAAEQEFIRSSRCSSNSGATMV